MKTIPFNQYVFNFQDLVRELFNHGNLQNIHLLVDGKYISLFEVGKDSSTIFHKLFYDKYRAGWLEMQALYNKFIREVMAKIWVTDFVYQAFPTFRVHLPGNLAVGAFHTDAEFNHPAGEVNYIIPLTNSNDTASVWVESEPGKADYLPITMELGRLIEFNGNKLRHGNKVNQTGKTRVSMDFRVLLMSDYQAAVGEHKGSITLGTKFVIGGYYKLFKHNNE